LRGGTNATWLQGCGVVTLVTLAGMHPSYPQGIPLTTLIGPTGCGSQGYIVFLCHIRYIATS